jgi:hypothetical protein
LSCHAKRPRSTRCFAQPTTCLSTSQRGIADAGAQKRLFEIWTSLSKEAERMLGVCARASPVRPLREAQDEFAPRGKAARLPGASVADFGSVPMLMTPGELGQLIVEETEKWAKVVKFSGAKPD